MLAQPSALYESASAENTPSPGVMLGLGKPETVAGPRSNQRDRLPTVSCVVPCLNEVVNLALLLPVLRRELLARASAWEIIVVDDGSTDATADLLESWANLAGIRSIQFSRNFGKEAALTAGMQAAAGEVVVLLDADMQHPPALIGSMIERWQGGADVVYAVRESRIDEPAFKRLGARLFYSMLNASARIEVPAGAGDFRLMDRAAVDAILSLPERNRFMKGLYAWVGFNAVPLPYMPADRATGHTKFSPLKLLGLSVDGLTAFTTWPLRMVSLGGIALALPAFIYGAFLVLDYFFDRDAVNGWTTIVVTLMLFLGIQMISLGILGEYIARIFEEVKGRPLFIVKRKLGQSTSEAPMAAGREYDCGSVNPAMHVVAEDLPVYMARDTVRSDAVGAVPTVAPAPEAVREAVPDAIE